MVGNQTRRIDEAQRSLNRASKMNIIDLSLEAVAEKLRDDSEINALTEGRIFVAPPEDVAPILLELDRLQEDQLKADILDYYASQNGGRFSGLNAQKRRDKSARRQERSIELKKQLQEASYDYQPLQFKQVFFITPFYTEKELARWGNPKQKYRVKPGLPDLVSDQSGCKHEVEARTLLEGSERALAEHLIRQCDYQSIRRTDRESAPIRYNYCNRI